MFNKPRIEVNELVHMESNFMLDLHQLIEQIMKDTCYLGTR